MLRPPTASRAPRPTRVPVDPALASGTHWAAPPGPACTIPCQLGTTPLCAPRRHRPPPGTLPRLAWPGLRPESLQIWPVRLKLQAGHNKTPTPRGPLWGGAGCQPGPAGAHLCRTGGARGAPRGRRPDRAVAARNEKDPECWTGPNHGGAALQPAPARSSPARTTSPAQRLSEKRKKGVT